MAQNEGMANDDVKRFSELLRNKEAAEQAAAEAERAARAAAKRLATARADKDAAVEALRVARQRGGAEQVAEADAKYRAALAVLVEVEQGKRPDWAPAEPVAETPEAAESASVHDGVAPEGDDTAPTDASLEVPTDASTETETGSGNADS